MEYTNLGRTSLKVSRICIGTMNFGEYADETQSHAVMSHALELGINFFDTANIYGGRVPDTDYFKDTTERYIGSWLARGGGRREGIVLATKMMGATGPGALDRGLSAHQIRRACDASLRRLQTDHIDLYQMHALGPPTPLDEVWQAMDTLIRQGKVLYVGSSNCPGWYLVEANMTAQNWGMLGPVSEQCRYNLAYRRAELDVLPVAERHGLGVIPYSPLGGGLLSGGILNRPREGRRGGELMQYVAQENREKVEAWERLCAEIGHRPTHVALAWLLRRPAVTAPIIGPRTPEQVEEAASALDLKLTDEAVRKIEDIWRPFGS